MPIDLCLLYEELDAKIMKNYAIANESKEDKHQLHYNIVAQRHVRPPTIPDDTPSSPKVVYPLLDHCPFKDLIIFLGLRIICRVDEPITSLDSIFAPLDDFIAGRMDDASSLDLSSSEEMFDLIDTIAGPRADVEEYIRFYRHELLRLISILYMYRCAGILKQV